MEPTEAPDQTAKAAPTALTLADEVVTVFKLFQGEDPDSDNRKHLWSQAVSLVAIAHQKGLV